MTKIIIYAGSMGKLSLIALAALLLYTGFLFLLRRGKTLKAIVKTAGALLTIAAVWAILSYTVLHRTPSGQHIAVFASAYSNEFYREMFMNTLLYLPLGMALSALIGHRSIPAALALSLTIEVWQYLAGTGVAQGTDVLCNALGATIGTLPYLIVGALCRERKTV